ncbi:MAG TPA: 30S ribosomal protein S9 [Candidatus Hypogeohydataceae bacterium YC41]
MAEVAEITKPTQLMGTGRRKTSVARVRLKEGSGKVLVNECPLNEHLTRERDRGCVLAPLKVTETLEKYDVCVNVSGGGLTGQAGAISMGIARALKMASPDYGEKLRDYGLLTRDSRMKERKKYGQKGARKSFQWTKR